MPKHDNWIEQLIVKIVAWQTAESEDPSTQWRAPYKILAQMQGDDYFNRLRSGYRAIQTVLAQEKKS